MESGDMESGDMESGDMESGHGNPTGDRHSRPNDGPVLVISCDSCVMRDTVVCMDCMMSVMCDVPDGGAVVLNLEELREIRLLAKAGLVPTLRHRAVG